MCEPVDTSTKTQKRGLLIRSKVGALPGLLPALLFAVVGSTHVSSVQADNEKPEDAKTPSTGDESMKSAKERIADAYQRAAASRPKVGGYPYLAEALRQAGVTRYVYTLPSGQCLLYANDGKVVNQSDVVVSGMLEVPPFNRDEFIKILRKSQNGDTTFPEFLKDSWNNGVVRYEADLVGRKVTYYGVDGESYVEEYPQVELPN